MNNLKQKILLKILENKFRYIKLKQDEKDKEVKLIEQLELLKS